MIKKGQFRKSNQVLLVNLVEHQKHNQTTAEQFLVLNPAFGKHRSLINTQQIFIVGRFSVIEKKLLRHAPFIPTRTPLSSPRPLALSDPPKLERGVYRDVKFLLFFS